MSRRAFIIGLLLAAFANFWPTYSSLVLHSSRADYAHLSLAMFIPFVALLMCNSLLEKRGWAFSSSELLTICSMGMIGALMQGEWISSYFLGLITAPLYFATPENRWADLIVDKLPLWSYVADPHAVRGFYEGLPEGHAFPYASWWSPLFWWGCFFAAVLTINLCVNVILRRQWMEHERLGYPIATALISFTGVSGSQGTLTTLLRNRLFQFGFGIVLFCIVWNIISWFFVGMPAMPILHGDKSKYFIPLGDGFPTFRFAISILTLVFGYFSQSDVLFSIWFFHVVAILQMGIFNRLGLNMGGSDPWGSFDPTVGWQSFGGLFIFVAWGLWMARAHLKKVFTQAFTRQQLLDDSGELFSYRKAVVLMICSLLFILLFLRSLGLEWVPLFTFVFATAVLYLGLARIVVESGLVFMRNPITAQAFTWHTVGMTGMTPLSATALAFTFTIFCDAKTFAMTAMAHIPRLGQAMNQKVRRNIASAVLMAALVGFITVVTMVLYYAYYVSGSYNFGVPSFNGSNDGPVGIWRLAANRIQAGSLTPDIGRMSFFGIGAIIVGLLLYARYLFPGFPLNPLGFTIAANAITQNVFVSIFIVWAIKSIILRVGGLDRYRKTAPLFLGMLMGYLAGVALGVVVDAIWFPGEGHTLITSF
jgi:hypothetical protein